MKDLDDSDADAPLFKDRNDLLDIVHEYENWFESLIDTEVYIVIETKLRKKKITKYIDAVVREFTQGKGWVAYDIDDNIYELDFRDFVNGRVCFKNTQGVCGKD